MKAALKSQSAAALAMLRHLALHTGELAERLGAHSDAGLEWISLA